jgi:hypothetical protein
VSPRADLTPAQRCGLTKTERRRRARAIRQSMRLYDLWQDPAITSSQPDRDADEQRWYWLLQARRELNELITMEGMAGGTKWTEFLNRRT